MFVNSGMVPFKDFFTGAQPSEHRRVTTAQKCMRVSGKHNDLEEVGRTRRHHTLFEMLGNFSFGDYFKPEAIEMAWQMVTRELQIQRERLYITVFGGDDAVPADAEARALWRKISGLPDGRILDMGARDNFWSMGETGPCGPCTEIHVDQGTGPVSQADFDSGRVMEIWNLVFMQYNRDKQGTLTPLPKPAVDTGMGLERVAALTQGADSNYHTDLFLPLIDVVAHRSGRPYGRSEAEDDVSMRVIADHARALAFLVADGVQPSNEGRGYVLRRILRRAIRHGRRLAMNELFLPEVAAAVVHTMGDAYPELRDAQELIAKVATAEEESFRRTLDGGLKILGDALGTLLSRVKQGPRPELSGEVVFKLYDTYGFPRDLTETIAQERGIAIDAAGFDAAMAEQQARSRQGAGASDGAGGRDVYHTLVRELGATPFIGYAHEEADSGGAREGDWREGSGHWQARATVRALVQNGERVQRVQAGSAVQVVLDRSPLYGEGGGQVGDSGALFAEDGRIVGEVTDTTRPVQALIVAHVQLGDAPLEQGDVLWVGYPASRRLQTRAHHSATHLLHHALRTTLGEHVKQAGSLVDDTHLRFDFTHFAAVEPEALARIEAAVNATIRAATPIQIEELALDEARGRGAVALFGEKYGERVRVISMGESIEFCGGTHAHNTADLQLLLITREQAVQSGVRRIEAEVGRSAVARVQACRQRLAAVADVLEAPTVAAALLHGLGEPPGGAPGALEQDAEAQAVLQAVRRAKGSCEQLRGQLQADDGPQLVVTPQALGLSRPRLGGAGPIDAQQARAVCDTWAALAQLASGRTQAAAAQVARLGEQDVGHLAAGVQNLLATAREGERARQAIADSRQAEGAQALAEAAATLPNGLRLVTHAIAGPARDLRELADHIRTHLGTGVVALAAHEGERVTLLVALTPDLVGPLSAGSLVREIAPHIEGRGGGKPDLAQAGGRLPGGIPAAFAALEALLSRQNIANANARA
jgi:alanyl-tRNA synthetase